MKTPLLFSLVLVFLIALASASDFATFSSSIFSRISQGNAVRDFRSLSSASAITCPYVECDRKVTEPCDKECKSNECHLCDISKAYCTSQGACANKKKVGEICSSGTECPGGPMDIIFGSGSCVYNATEDQSRCSDGKRPGNANDGCSENSSCNYGLNCTSSVCVGKPVGASCSHPEECAFGLGCSSDDKCETQAPEGNACSKSSECEDGATCSSGVCIMPFSKKLGEPCQSTEVCDGGLFCNATSETCQTIPPIKYCNGTGQCESGEICTCMGYNRNATCFSNYNYYNYLYTKEVVDSAKKMLSCSKSNQCKLQLTGDPESCLMKHCNGEIECYILHIAGAVGYPTSCLSGLTCNDNPQSSTNGAPSSTLFSAIILQVVLVVVSLLLN